MTPEDLQAIDEYIEAYAKLLRARLLIHYRTRKRADAETEATARAWQRLALRAGITVTNDEAWAKFADRSSRRSRDF